MAHLVLGNQLVVQSVGRGYGKFSVNLTGKLGHYLVGIDNRHHHRLPWERQGEISLVGCGLLPKKGESLDATYKLLHNYFT